MIKTLVLFFVPQSETEIIYGTFHIPYLFENIADTIK